MLNHLALLGPVSLTGPEARSLRRASQQRRLALLALLASAPDMRASRDRLVGLLWPERDERAARHLLADSVYVLRQALGDDAIVASGEALHLSADALWSDVAAFQQAIRDDQWSEALDLYRGDFLDGFFLRDAAEFDQWAVSERNRLRTLAARAASALTCALERDGRIADAAAAAERALDLSPCDEATLRVVVRLHIAAGNRGRAEAVAQAFIERMALELGMSPSPETMSVLQESRAVARAKPIVVVAAGARRPPGARPIDSVTASIIVRARHHWHQRTQASVTRAIEYFTRAAERDARAVDAWCGLADAWVVMGGRGYAPIADAINRASASAERALALDDTLSSVYTSVGGVNILRRRWHDAETSLNRAIELDPQNADARHWLALTLLTGYGNCDGAVREQTVAARLNPLAAIQVGTLGWQRYLRGEYDLSRSEMEPTVDLNAELEEGHAGLARAAARLGDESTVMATIAAGLTRRTDLRGDLLAEQASALAVLGDSRRGRQVALEASAHGASPINLALAWATLGEADRAFQALARESFLVYWAPQAVWWDPRFDGIRGDSRFARVRERAAGVWAPEWR
jgi:DNA-binding SARP family transcriptional activator